MRDLIYVCFRSLFFGIFLMVGLGIGILPLVYLYSEISSTSTTTSEVSRTYTPTIVPNAKGERKKLSTDSPVILKLNIDGVVGLDKLTAEKVGLQLVESREGDLKSNRVKAILLHINTPGGTVNDADSIYRALKTYKERYHVPIYAYVDGLCASGGMYIAAAADKIFATEVSMVGSIGALFSTFFNFTDLLDKLGVSSVTITAGKDKDELNPFRKWKPDEAKNLQGLVDDFYNDFVDIIVTNRPKVNRDDLIKVYGAKLFSAKTGTEIGYIDESSASYDSTLTQLLKHIGIEDDYYQVMQLTQKTWYSELFETKSPIFTGEIQHQIRITPELDPRLMNRFLYLYQPNG